MNNTEKSFISGDHVVTLEYYKGDDFFVEWRAFKGGASRDIKHSLSVFDRGTIRELIKSKWAERVRELLAAGYRELIIDRQGGTV